jgi:hypothetical protein
MGLETCCMLAANIVAIHAAGELLHARARSYTPTSRRTACILKLAAKSGLVFMAMLALRYRVPFQEEISICLRCRWSRWPIFSFQSPNTTNGVLASP